jgi:hypothetical protein
MPHIPPIWSAKLTYFEPHPFFKHRFPDAASNFFDTSQPAFCEWSEQTCKLMNFEPNIQASVFLDARSRILSRPRLRVFRLPCILPSKRIVLAAYRMPNKGEPNIPLKTH